MFNDGVLM